MRLRLVPHGVLTNGTPLVLVLRLPDGPSVTAQPQQAQPFDWQPLRKRPRLACLLVNEVSCPLLGGVSCLDGATWVHCLLGTPLHSNERGRVAKSRNWSMAQLLSEPFDLEHGRHSIIVLRSAPTGLSPEICQPLI